MERKPDRRVRRTRAQLRQGLAQLMGEKSVNEVTVTELVDLVDINRSTFYLHYRDIPHMLECVEQELYEQIRHAMEQTLTGRFEGDTLAFLEDVFSILFANRDICAALLGPGGTLAFSTTLRRCSPSTFSPPCSAPSRMWPIATPSAWRGAWASSKTGCPGGAPSPPRTWPGVPTTSSPG